APPEAIVRVARAHGLDAAVHDDTTRAELAQEIVESRPVIVDLQAWADAPRASWADDWDDGHYVVLIAIEGDTLVFEDPTLAGKRSTLSADELNARWHDEDAKRRHAHTAIVFHTAPPTRRVERLVNADADVKPRSRAITSILSSVSIRRALAAATRAAINSSRNDVP